MNTTISFAPVTDVEIREAIEELDKNNALGYLIWRTHGGASQKDALRFASTFTVGALPSGSTIDREIDALIDKDVLIEALRHGVSVDDMFMAWGQFREDFGIMLRPADCGPLFNCYLDFRRSNDHVSACSKIYNCVVRDHNK